MTHLCKFMLQGFRNLRATVYGRYKTSVDGIDEMRDAVFNQSSMTDLERMREDRRKVSADIRKSYNRIVVNYG